MMSALLCHSEVIGTAGQKGAIHCYVRLFLYFLMVLKRLPCLTILQLLALDSFKSSKILEP